jgi:uncharacterized protein YjbI with pentapeptide repeats
MAEKSHKSSRTPRSTSKDARRRGHKAARRAALNTAAMQSENLDKIKDAVADSANTARNTWILFLSFGTYLAVAVGSVTHRQLLLEEPIRLPLLDVDLPLVAFFVIAPTLLLIFHVYTLMHLKLMSDKVHYYNSVVRRLGFDKATEDHLRLRLPDFMFVQYLAGPGEGWKSLMHWLLVAGWLTVLFLPVILLLLVQLKFLPYHLQLVTWWQQAIIVLDLVLLWRFLPTVLLGSGSDQQFASVNERSMVAFGGLLILFSFLFAVYPGEYGKIVIISTGECVNGWLPFSNTLDLTDQHLVDGDIIEKITARNQREAENASPEYAYSFKKRDLNCARLDNADLRQVDLSGAELQGVSLKEANLNGASLANANLRNAEMYNAKLQGATLSNAKLQGADLGTASLQGSDLYDAKLQGAILSYAYLQGATLSTAHLEGATLDSANLQATDLVGAYLQGAMLKSAKLQGAFLDSANLWGANLSGAELGGTSLEDAGLWRTFGEDKPVTLSCVWLKEPQLQAPSKQQFAKWEHALQEVVDDADQGVDDNATEKRKREDIIQGVIDAAVQGVDDDAAKKRIRDALARLSLPKQDVQNSLDDYWNNLANNASKVEYQEDLLDRLTNLACLDSFVAKSLVSHYFRSPSIHAGREKISGKLAATFVKAADSNQCPGLEKITHVAMASMRNRAARDAQAAQVESKTKSTAK